MFTPTTRTPTLGFVGAAIEGNAQRTISIGSSVTQKKRGAASCNSLLNSTVPILVFQHAPQISLPDSCHGEPPLSNS